MVWDNVIKLLKKKLSWYIKKQLVVSQFYLVCWDVFKLLEEGVFNQVYKYISHIRCLVLTLNVGWRHYYNHHVSSYYYSDNSNQIQQRDNSACEWIIIFIISIVRVASPLFRRTVSVWVRCVNRRAGLQSETITQWLQACSQILIMFFNLFLLESIDDSYLPPTPLFFYILTFFFFNLPLPSLFVASALFNSLGLSVVSLQTSVCSAEAFFFVVWCLLHRYSSRVKLFCSLVLT